MKRANGTSSPAGHIGGLTILYDGSGVCNLNGPHYSSTSLALFIVTVAEKPSCGGAGYYQQRGSGAAYRTSDGVYVPKQSAYTPWLYSN